MTKVRERFTDAVLDVADTYDDVSLARGLAENVLDELLPEITDVRHLIVLPVGSVLLGRDGTAWVRTGKEFQPWASVDRGGYGSSVSNLIEISERLLDNEGPLMLVWVP